MLNSGRLTDPRVLLPIQQAARFFKLEDQLLASQPLTCRSLDEIDDAVGVKDRLLGRTDLALHLVLVVTRLLERLGVLHGLLDGDSGAQKPRCHALEPLPVALSAALLHDHVPPDRVEREALGPASERFDLDLEALHKRLEHFQRAAYLVVEVPQRGVDAGVVMMHRGCGRGLLGFVTVASRAAAPVAPWGLLLGQATPGRHHRLFRVLVVGQAEVADGIIIPSVVFVRVPSVELDAPVRSRVCGIVRVDWKIVATKVHRGLCCKMEQGARYQCVVAI